MKQAALCVTPDAPARVRYGASLVESALRDCGYEVATQPRLTETGCPRILVAMVDDAAIQSLLEADLLIFHAGEPQGEGFVLETCSGGLTCAVGGNGNGVLYACQALAARIREEGALPLEIAVYDAPAFKLRGLAVGLQKTEVEPPRLTYEYPITRERFPWFYDRALWTRFLNQMLDDRCNILYLWTGLPFSSLVKVADYPFALEVSEAQFEENRTLFAWLTEEADKRGIWVVLKFYSIHIPLPFAEHFGLPLLQSSIHPLAKDYTYKAIIEFIKGYPSVGLMVCLGEALRGNAQKTEWFVETIIPAVKEGLRQAGIESEPPLILRGHDCDPVDAMQKALPLYGNLYTMWKYNGEGLTTYRMRGVWRQRHLALKALGGAHILNVHILANLEPFRFAAPLFIQKCVQAGQHLLGGNGLHLYPLFFWDWPYAPDKTAPRLLQMERDRLWYAAWMRYAWQPARGEADERAHWTRYLAAQYAIPENAAAHLLSALESAAECAPRILGRIGITEGNRQTMSLGMTMSQLTNAVRYRPNQELYNSVATVGETLETYARRLCAGEPHQGETPPEMAEKTMRFAERAADEYRAATALCGEGSAEFTRIGSDIEAIRLMTLFYCKKVEAALLILRYRFTMNQDCAGDTGLLEAALFPWEESLAAYRALAALTKDTYLYANSMQTPQRKIPFPDGKRYGHWTQCLPEYEAEFVAFKDNLARLKTGWLPGNAAQDTAFLPLPSASYEAVSPGAETYPLEKDANLFTDAPFAIADLAPELTGLTGTRFGLGHAIEVGTELTLRFPADCKLLLGYFAASGVEWLKPPELETNTHADARGGLSPVITNAIRAKGCPGAHIHVLRYEKGEHTLSLGTGGYLVLGAVPTDCEVTQRNAGLAGEGLDTLDWLYEVNAG